MSRIAWVIFGLLFGTALALLALDLAHAADPTGGMRRLAAESAVRTDAHFDRLAFERDLDQILARNHRQFLHQYRSEIARLTQVGHSRCHVALDALPPDCPLSAYEPHARWRAHYGVYPLPLAWAPADFPVSAYWIYVCMASPCTETENHQLYGTTRHTSFAMPKGWSGTVFVTAVRPDGSEEMWTGLVWVGEE